MYTTHLKNDVLAWKVGFMHIYLAAWDGYCNYKTGYLNLPGSVEGS